MCVCVCVGREGGEGALVCFFVFCLLFCSRFSLFCCLFVVVVCLFFVLGFYK